MDDISWKYAGISWLKFVENFASEIWSQTDGKLITISDCTGFIVVSWLLIGRHNMADICMSLNSFIFLFSTKISFASL